MHLPQSVLILVMVAEKGARKLAEPEIIRAASGLCAVHPITCTLHGRNGKESWLMSSWFRAAYFGSDNSLPGQIH
jgi:hypothetical protein